MEEEGGRKRKREGQEQGLFNHWCKRGIVLNSTDSRLLLSIVDDASGRPSGNTVGVAAARPAEQLPMRSALDYIYSFLERARIPNKGKELDLAIRAK